MYYYNKMASGQKMYCASEKYGTEAQKAGLKESDEKFMYIEDGELKEYSSPTKYPRYTILSDHIKNPPLTDPKGLWAIYVTDEDGRFVLLDRFSTKNDAKRLLPGLSYYHTSVALFHTKDRLPNPKTGLWLSQRNEEVTGEI